jgi:predicted negative regulator of RcsB-dependent stress response
MADNVLKSDEEKAEELKAWWKSNGLSVVAGVALAIAGMFGWQQWQQHKLDQSEGASKILSQINKNPTDSELLKKINTEYGNTPYAALAELNAAKTACNTNKMDNCIKQLTIASKSSQADIAIIAKIRLARTLISINKLDEANTLISSIKSSAYSSIVAELNGDLLLAKNEVAKAREAYDKALLSSGGQNSQLLKMKRDDMGDGS